MTTPYSSAFGSRMRGASSAGFSLIEMLVVLAIVSILATASLAAIQGTQSGVSLKGSGSTAISEMNLAWQTAATRNTPVDLRIYKIPDVSGNSNNPQYRAMQIVIPTNTGTSTTYEYVDRPVTLQGDVVFQSSATGSISTSYSPLIDNGDTAASLSGTLDPYNCTSGDPGAPYLVQNQPYVMFTFMPSGAVTISGSTTLNGALPTLTLINQHYKAATVTGTPAANYITIVLDTVTGRTSYYQP